jgi:hypothetical protein
MCDGNSIAPGEVESRPRGAKPDRGSIVRRTLWVILAMLVVFGAGLRIGTASDRDETVITVVVGAADHELQEGYFTLGDQASVMARPGSDLYKFLTRQRGRKVRVTLSEASGPELSRLHR